MLATNDLDYAGWASVAISAVAFIAVVVEYRRQTRQSRLQLAQEMIGKLYEDELLSFATTALDWGGGLVVIPDSWRDVVGKPSVPYDFLAIKDAMEPQLPPSAAGDPIKLLYRHAFVHLFNHLERIGTLAEGGAIDIRDLGPMAFVAHQLLSWSYTPHGEKTDAFMRAMREWYKDATPETLIKRIAGDFPRKP
jgi:hypothetical protein